MKTKILFVCIHNSARSQMAEAFVNRYCSDCFEAKSAGLEPGQLNAIVVEAMAEDGIDISQNETKSVQDILRTGKSFDYVITVCDEASAERCPVFPGSGRRLHWSFPDPSQFTGIHAERWRKRATCATPSRQKSPIGARNSPASATRRIARLRQKRGTYFDGCARSAEGALRFPRTHP